MNKFFISLSLMMGVVVLSSNYLVQFPINYYGLNEILTYGAFSYPVAFLITDLANRSYGRIIERKIVYLGFFIGILFYSMFFNKRRRFNIYKNCNWIRNRFPYSPIAWYSNIWSSKKKTVVCCTTNFITNWFNCWYFFIFLNIILWNRSSLGNFIFRWFRS